VEDAALLSLAAIVLRLCRPFAEGYLAPGGPGPKWRDLFQKHLQASQPSRLRPRAAC